MRSINNLSLKKIITKLTNYVISQNLLLKKEQKISLRIVLAASFVTQILVIVGIFAWASLSKKEKIVQQLATQLNTEISHRVSHELEDVLEVPYLIYQINQDLIQLELLTLNALKFQESLFWQQIQQFNLTKIQFGSSGDEFISLEQKKDGSLGIKLMTKLNPGSLEEYSADAQGNLIEKLKTDEYNHRNQSWYSRAFMTGKPVWSQIYNWNALSETLSISASYPMYDRNQNFIGVLGVEQSISHISELLQTLNTSESGVIYVMEKSGLMVASSSDEKSYYLVNNQPERLSFFDSNNPLAKATGKKILQKFSQLNQISTIHHLEFEIDGKKHFVQLTPWQNKFGLELVIIVTLPASEFISEINQNSRMTILLFLLEIVLASYLAILASRWITQPILKLSQATADIAKEGSLPEKLKIFSFSEFTGLVQSFNQMSERLKNNFLNLEKRIEERTTELKKSEEKFYKIFHYSPVSMMILQLPEKTIFDVNENFSRIFGYDREEIIGKNCVEVNLIDNPTIYEQITQTLQSTGKIRNQEIEISTKLGTEKIIELSGETIEIDGKICIIYVLSDITKRRQAEIERDRFFNISLDLLAIAGNDGYFKRLNPLWSKKLGYTTEELLAVPYIEFIHPEDRDSSLKEARKITEGATIYNFQNRWRSIDGSYRWLAWNSIPVLEEGLIYAVARDITDEKEALEILRRSQTQLAEAQKFAHIGSWENDLTTGQAIWSEELYHIFGLDPNLTPVTGEDYLRLVHPDDLPALQKAIDLAINHGQSYEFDQRIIAPDASIKHISLTGKPIFNDEGKVIKLFGTILDITQRKQTEIALRESEERFRQLAENIDSMFWMRDLDSNQIIYISPSYEKIWGRSRQQLYASPNSFLDTIHPEDRPGITAFLANLTHTETEQKYRILRPNGEIRWIWDRAFPIKNQAGEVYRIAGISEDISENKLAEVERKLSQERLQLALEASGDGLWDWNITTGEFYYSSQWLKMLGYEENELLGHISSWEMLIHPEDRGWVMDALNLHLEDSSFIYAFDYRLRTKSDQWKWIATYGKVVSRDETGKPARMLGTHKDISDRKAAEVALQEQVALEQLVSSISTSFINLNPEQIDSSIELALQQLGELTGIDRSYMFLVNNNRTHINNTHEWCARGIQPQIENLQDISQDSILWFMKKLYKFEVIHIPVVANMPSEANTEKQILLAQSIQSLLWIPMISGSELIGFVGFDAVRQAYTWRDSTINLLKIIAEIFTRALEYQETELALRESEQRFRIMADSAPVLIWMSATDNLCNYFNQTWLNFTGRSLAQEVENGWIEGIHPEDMQQCLETYVSNFHRCQAFTMEYRLRRADGEYRWVLATGVPRFNLDGNFVGYIGSCIDISDRKQAEEQIQASLQEKEILLKEIHHRVKNNLHVISNLLDLQSDYIEDKKVQELFADSQNRIQTMALIHEQLYQSKDLGEIDFSEYIHTLIDNLFFSYSDRASIVKPLINVEPITLNIETAIPCGLLINELVTNSFKHAFPDHNSGEVCIKLHQDEQQKIYLTIKDNGIGIPSDFDWQNTPSLGLKLVRILSKQLKAEIEFDASSGTSVHLTFYPLKYKPRF